jgi:hypothetical protein
MGGSRILSSVESNLSAFDPVHAKRQMLCVLASGTGWRRLLGLPQADG